MSPGKAVGEIRSALPNFMGISVSGNTDSSGLAIIAQLQRGGSELLDDLKNDWLRLCVSGGCNTPYNRPEYFAAYIREFEPHSKIVVVTVRIEGSLVGILPLVEAQEIWYGIPVRLLTSPQADHYPWFDLICREGIDQTKVCEAILKELNRYDGLDAIRLRRVAEGSAAYKLLQADFCHDFSVRWIEETRVPYVSIARSKGGFESFIGAHSQNFRHMIRKALRKADRSGGLSIRRFETADPVALGEFYRIEASGWKGKEGTAISCHPPLIRFYNETANAAADGGYFRLYLAYLGPRAIAGLFAFQLDGRLSVPKLGYDEEYKQFAPGHLLVHEVLKECWESDVREFDFLGSWMRWKADWTPEYRTSGSIYLYKNNLKGWILEKIRFGLLPIAREVYRRVRPVNSENET
jgi:CelD/BcsL family acetyltransferase involved in cellulose biosynthesis